MKNKKSIPPLAPIILGLNNGSDKFEVHRMIFSVIKLLLDKEDPAILDYIAYLDFCTAPQVILLCNRIMDKKNREVLLNQQHFIIFYSMMHLTVQLYKSTRMKASLKNVFPVDSEKTYDTICEGMISMCNYTLDDLRSNYKKNNYIINALVKIDAYKISE